MRFRLIILIYFFGCVSVSAQIQHLNAAADYQKLAGKPLTDLYSNVQSLKICYDIKDGRVYFIDSKRYPFHYDFCAKELNYKLEVSDFNAINYAMHKDRRFVFACLNYHINSAKYLLEFVSEEDITAELLKEFYNKVVAATPFIDTLYVLLNNQNLLQLSNNIRNTMPSILPDAVFGSQKFQSLVTGTAYGYLRRIKSLKGEMASVKSNEIILIDGSPIALPICAGVLTNAMQTPLSHINVLCSNRQIPAGAWRYHENDSMVNALVGKPVKLTVTKSTILIQPASAKYIKPVQKNTTLRNIPADVATTTIYRINPATLTKVAAPQVKTYGSKALGMYQLHRIQAKYKSFEVPNGVAMIPFYYYKQHMQQPEIKKQLAVVLKLAATNYNEQAMEVQLKQLRKLIKQAPLNAQLVKKITEHIIESNPEASYRFRSSSNAEDLAGFNGAGLYGSYSGKLNDSNKTISEAIKKVWASVWSIEAFRERKLYNINQSTVMMAVLVHQGFPNEEANGVAITKNMLRDNFEGHTVNVQIGETSVVAPPDSVTCDQLIIIPTDYFIGESGGSYAQYITKSNINTSRITVLNKEQIQQLNVALTDIKDYYYYVLKKNVANTTYANYALDIEFKFNDGKLYIKQVRPFK